MHNIQNIYKQELEYLEDGIKNSKNPYHTFSFSSINGKWPESRTVVLRALGFNPLRIYFNADYRSPKVKELKNNSFCSALFYNQERRVQLRFKCQASIHYQNNISSEVWNDTALQSKKCYMGPYSPSEILDDWHPNIPLEYIKKDPEKEHSEEGYINFVHIELKVNELDILELHHDGHIRFRVNDKGNISYLSP